jgi:hypothetical protein
MPRFRAQGFNVDGHEFFVVVVNEELFGGESEKQNVVDCFKRQFPGATIVLRMEVQRGLPLYHTYPPNTSIGSLIDTIEPVDVSEWEEYDVGE